MGYKICNQIVYSVEKGTVLYTVVFMRHNQNCLCGLEKEKKGRNRKMDRREKEMWLITWTIPLVEAGGRLVVPDQDAAAAARHDGPGVVYHRAHLR
jgi:hypothetical protein